MSYSFRNCLFIFILLFPHSHLLPQDSTLINLRRTDNTPLKNHNFADKEKLYPVKPVSTGTGIWTELNPKVPRVDYLGIHFINTDIGWACGDLGTIIKSTDGGQSWQTLETNSTTPILKVRSYNGQVVIASGFDGLILRSIDEGNSWTQATSGVAGDLWGLQMINDTLGWACGNYNSLSKTTDGGLTWQRVFTPGYTSSYWWIDFLTESYGFIAADGKVLRTTNGGNNWDIIQAGDNYPLFTIDAIDSLHIAAAGYGGTDYVAKNLYSSDGGNTWTDGGQTTTGAINCICYINSDTGYITMSEVGIWKTTNRGGNWELLDPNSPNFQGEYEIQLFSQENIGYDAGSGLRIYKAEGNLDEWEKLIINDNINDVYFTSSQTGYILSGAVYKTMNGGENWFRLQNFPYNVFISSLNSIVFIDSLTGFAGGPPCRIVKTTDAGHSWHVTNLTGLTDTIGTINKIFFISATMGWAVTSRGGILKTNDAGENWLAQLNMGIYVSFRSIFFIDSLLGWTANLADRPYKTTDGGTNWIQQTNLNIWSSRDVFFANRDTGWIVDNTNWRTVIRTTDGGVNWTTIPEILGPSNFHFFPDSKHWLINGTPQKYITEDGGNSWIDITNDAPWTINSFNSVTNKLGYAVGGLGIILRYDDTSYVPVELISFEGRIAKNEITLSWITASELNNQGFEIERSCDRTNWETIGFINGKGTTTKINYYFFVDHKPLEGEINYRLKQVDYAGTFIFSKTVTIYFENTPLIFELLQNYPNPFNAVTRISFSIPVDSKVKLEIFDVLGKEVKTIINKDIIKGNYNIDFDASDLNSGVYFYRVMAEGINGKRYDLTKKMIVTK